MSASSRRLRISDVLLFTWDVLWVASFFLSDRDEAFAYFFDFAALAFAMSNLPIILLGDVTFVAVYLFALMSGVSTFTGATALLAHINGASVPRIQLLLTASMPTVAFVVWGSANASIRTSALSLRRTGNLASADPLRVLLASLTWIVAPVVFAATYSFEVNRVLFQSGLCFVHMDELTAAPTPSPDGRECGVEWASGCQCSLFYIRHLVIICLTVICFIILILLELLATPNRSGVVLVR